MFASILVSSNNKVFDRIKGIDSFTDEISSIINNKDLAVSDRIIFSNISYQMRSKPNRIFMPYDNRAPVTNHFQISTPLDSNRKDSFFLLGRLDDVSYLSKKHRGELIKVFGVPFEPNQLELYEINFK